MSLSPALKVARELCPYPLTGVSDEQLGDILDAWLADEFARDSHVHIHSWSDAEVVQ
jgi:hypothetical protein